MHHRYVTSHAAWDHTIGLLLAIRRGDIAVFTPAS